MEFRGEVTLMGESLSCCANDTDWSFRIRHINKNISSNFQDLDGKIVTPTDVAEYFPNWKNLKWTEIENNRLSKSKSQSNNTSFKIIIASRSSGTKTHEDVVNAFCDFMQDT